MLSEYILVAEYCTKEFDWTADICILLIPIVSKLDEAGNDFAATIEYKLLSASAKVEYVLAGILVTISDLGLSKLFIAPVIDVPTVEISSEPILLEYEFRDIAI